MTATSLILEGDCRDVLAGFPDACVQTCVTSPPYFGLRDYGHGGQIGLEPSPDEFTAALVEVFREVRRVLRDDGTVWLNLGDSYNNRTKVRGTSHQPALNGFTDDNWHERAARGGVRMSHSMGDGVKEKDLLGIPWMVAFALRADGWYLRSDIIWNKPNPMPESVTDRPTKAHEYLFLLSKGPRYFYDADAIREPHTDPKVVDGVFTGSGGVNRDGYEPQTQGFVSGGGGVVMRDREYNPAGRNKRSVWTVATQPYPGAHFATFPPKLIEPCILAGAPERACGTCGAPYQRVVERVDTGRRQKMADGWDVDEGGHGSFHRNGRAKGETGVPVMENRTVGFEPSCDHDAPAVPGVVLDPFAGAGTTGLVAAWRGRSFAGIELNPEYAAMARERIRIERYATKRQPKLVVIDGQLELT